MESYGYVFDEEWMNLGSIFSCDQDSNHFIGHGLFSNDYDGHGLNLETPIFCPISSNESNSSDSLVIHDHILSYPSDRDLKSNFDNSYFSQDSSSATDSPPPQSCHDIFSFSPSKTHRDNVSDESNNFLLLAQIFSDDAMEEILCLKQDEVDVKGKKDNSTMPIADQDKETFLKRKYELLVEIPNASKEEAYPKKKTRVARDNKSKKNLAPKKNQKMMTVNNANEDDVDEESNIHKKEKTTTSSNKGRANVQISSSSCSSEGDDSNASQDADGGALTKTRAGRGAATDPQSIYARKRRERINERLKILQTLVPNGTKVDISTMLEEAVHYVKFLQLQIKLLSSDETWMYAPIAYNGMDMGLYQNISQN